MAAVAVACGVKRVYAKSGMRAKQLRPFKLWAEGSPQSTVHTPQSGDPAGTSNLPEFPKRESRGWVRAEVIKAWESARAAGWSIVKDEWKWEKPEGNVPPGGETAENGAARQHRPTGDGDGELALDSSGYERTLDLWEDKLNNPQKWVMVPLQQWQLKALREARPHLFKRGEGRVGEKDGTATWVTPGGMVIPQFEVLNQAAMAELISKSFKFPCSEQDVSDWKLCKRLPTVDGQEAPAFPSPRTRGGWDNARAAFLWYERWIYEPAKRGGSAQSALDLGTRAREKELQQKIDSAELTALQLASEQRELDNRWCLREEARRACFEAAQGWAKFTETELEKSGPRARKEKLDSLFQKLQIVPKAPSTNIQDPEKIQTSNINSVLEEFYAWDVEQGRGVMDRIRARCAEAGKAKFPDKPSNC